MPEKFMFIAIAVYLLTVFATAAVEAYWPQYSTITTSKKRSFYISLLQWMAILAFLVISHPFIYRHQQTLSLAELLAPNRYTIAFIILGFSLIAISSHQRLKRFTRHWWSPLPLILAILSSVWLSLMLANSSGNPLIAWPDWRFVCVSSVIYVAALLISDMFLFFGSNVSSPAWHRTVAETTRLCSVLPAFLVFLLGLGIE